MSDHNGWANYATWRVNLELVEDYLSSIAEDIEGGYQDKFEDVGTLADVIKDYVGEVISGELDGTERDSALDLVRSYADAFVSDVDWYQIAGHWTELIGEPCDECGNIFDDNPGKSTCQTCEDWRVTE